MKIDIGAIRENIQNYKKRLSQKTKFCAVVKADAYGFGAKRISREINDLVDYFAVSSIEEFFEIKQLINKPILILDPIYENITKAASKGCEFCISNREQIKIFLQHAIKNPGVKFKLHLAINTGMNRFGFNYIDGVIESINLLKKAQNIVIVGVFSHFYSGNIEKCVKNQSRQFEEKKNTLTENGLSEDVVFHISNTSGFEFDQHFDMVRIGYGMFSLNNKDAFSLEANIVEIRSIKKGEVVGYGCAFVAPKKMSVAVVSIGYADGVFRCIAGKGFVIVNGKFCKILAVCMDSIIIDISDANTCLNDKVTLIGKDGCLQIFICDFASWCGTIGYEIMTRISKRVKRVYLGGITNANHNGEIQSEKT